MTVKTLLLLGMGSIQKALLELLAHERHWLLSLSMICVCPEDIPDYILNIKSDLLHIKTSITEDNVVNLLEPLINSDVLVIDLTVNVETIDIIKLCKKHGVMYINSSLEKYNKDEVECDPEKTTLYYQEICLNNALAEIQATRPENETPTIIHSMGMNPGAISALMYQCIESYCREYNPEMLEILSKGDWNIVANQVLHSAHISEYDNQQINKNLQHPGVLPGVMINSWSGAGLVAEALSISFVSSQYSMPDYEKSSYNPRIYYSTKDKAMDKTMPSICLYPDGTPFEYDGIMITHFEVVSLSKSLSVESKSGDIEYVPWLSYVYSPSSISQQCLEYIHKNNYKEPDNYYVFNQQDITHKNTFDSIGAFCHFKDGRRFWCGTVLTNAQAISILGESARTNATQLQVVISILAGIEWMLENPNKGVITAEAIPHKYILSRCIPY